MHTKESLDTMAITIGTLGREELKRRIRGFKGRFKLDFDEAYLNGLSIDRLRHILMAALITSHLPVKN